MCGYVSVYIYGSNFNNLVIEVSVIIIRLTHWSSPLNMYICICMCVCIYANISLRTKLYRVHERTLSINLSPRIKNTSNDQNI